MSLPNGLCAVDELYEARAELLGPHSSAMGSRIVLTPPSHHRQFIRTPFAQTGDRALARRLSPAAARAPRRGWPEPRLCKRRRRSPLLCGTGLLVGQPQPGASQPRGAQQHQPGQGVGLQAEHRWEKTAHLNEANVRWL